MMKSKCNNGLRTLAVVTISLAIIFTFTMFGLYGGIAMAQNEEPPYRTDFQLENCEFLTTGSNRYFNLEPGYELVLEGEEDGETIRVVITVLDETESIFLPDIGEIQTRVVEEREWVDDELIEVSRNLFARCAGTNNIFYFGEDVDICEDGLEPDNGGYLCDGEEPDHEGAWRAGVDDAMPGLIMPGLFIVGDRYFQEIAPGVAMDRAENVAIGLIVTTPAGTFEECVKVLETTPLEPGEESEKIYCPEVGLVVDDEVELVEPPAGFKAPDGNGGGCFIDIASSSLGL